MYAIKYSLAFRIFLTKLVYAKRHHEETFFYIEFHPNSAKKKIWKVWMYIELCS